MNKLIGGIVGFLCGGVLACIVFCVIVGLATGTNSVSTGEMTPASCLVFWFGPLAGLVGAIAGAVAGARIAAKEK